MSESRLRRFPYVFISLLGLLFLWRFLFDIFVLHESSMLEWWRGNAVISGTQKPLPKVILAPGSKVAIINIAKFHHEVYPAFHYAFQRAGYVTNTYAYSNGGNITDGLKYWNFTMTGLNLFFCPQILCEADLIVFTSWECLDDFKLSIALLDKGCVKSFVFVIHNAEKRMLPLLEQVIRYNVSIELYTLGPHTAHTMRKLLESHDDLRGLRVSYLVPIFPFQCAGDTNSTRHRAHRWLQGAGSSNITAMAESKNHTTFAIQGLFSPLRRNYTKLFFDLVEHKEEVPNHFRLVVLGSGFQLSIPKAIVSNIVRRVNGRPYCIYNALIRDSVGLLTAFASDIYYKTKASSSVASSLINQAPLLTSKRTIKTYTYLSPSSVWIKRPNQSDVEAIIDILALPDLNKQLLKRKKSIARDIARAYQHNLQTVATTIASFRDRAQNASDN